MFLGLAKQLVGMAIFMQNALLPTAKVRNLAIV
jgi:hypothetical protein